MSVCKPSLSVCSSKYPVQCSGDFDEQKEYLKSLVFITGEYNSSIPTPNTPTFRTVIISDRFPDILPDTVYLIKVGFQLVGDGKSANSSNWTWRLSDDGGSFTESIPPAGATLVSKGRSLDTGTASIENVSWTVRTSGSTQNWRIFYTFSGRSDSLLTDTGIYCQVYKLPQ